MGVENTRLAALPHTGQVTDGGAVPSGRVTSNIPSSSHRYSYIAMGGGPPFLNRPGSVSTIQLGAMGTGTACLT
jgi:hypothetical protein